jgi:glutathione synthase/RimK-type ligase-like ATP-grasp enzyme
VQAQTRLVNDAATVRWNLDKHYLADLEARGVPVVRSRFVERGAAVHLRELLGETGWAEAVVKPCVSGAARHTYRVNAANADYVNGVVRPLLESEALILQPFEPAVVEHSEDSLMVVGGRHSHAVRKVAKAGDFRVQDDHGGTTSPYQPTAGQVELAERVIASCRPVPAYGRVDLIHDALGRDAVMELELVEPELWPRNRPEAAAELAAAIGQLL